MIFDRQIFISINVIERSHLLKLKFTNFSTNREPNPIYNFLLVINTNLHPISHRFQVLQIIGQICAFDRGYLSLTDSFGVNP